MKTRATLFWVALAAILFMGCSMPQLGMGPSLALTGDQEGSSQGTAGSISVVMDETRGIAVFINENGARFDVAAEESPGGSLVKCIELADFTMVPQTGDIDSLPVKALVTGTREDGNPGVWEINADDTITLPEPEQNGTDPSRCIVGGVLTSLPDGMHVRFGWVFKTTGMSADGKIIVGRAEHRKGFSYNGVQVLPGSSVGVYWKVYRLPYSRFCIISPPRVLGTFVKEPMPAGWTPKAYTVPAILAQLKQFFIGRLEAYLVDANLPPDTTEGVDLALRIVEYEPALGVYIVRGPDQDGKRAVAKINKNDSIEIVRVPDLHIAAVTASPMADGTNFTWDVPWKATVTVENLDTDGYEGMSTGGTLTLSLGGVSTNEFFHSVSLSELKLGESKNFTFDLSPTINFFGQKAGQFTLSAEVMDPGDFEEITGNNSVSTTFYVEPVSENNPPELRVTPPAALNLQTTDAWPSDGAFTISNEGKDTATNVQLVYEFKNTEGTDIKQAPKTIADIPGGTSLPEYPTLPTAIMGYSPGTWTVTLKVYAKDVLPVTSAVTLLVYYEDLVIDTFNVAFVFDPKNENADGYALYSAVMELYDSANALIVAVSSQVSRPDDFDPNDFYQYYPYILTKDVIKDKQTGLLPGDYSIRLYLVNKSGNESLRYAIRLERTPPPPYPASAEAANLIPTALPDGQVDQIIGIGQVFQQTLETGQVHWYKFTLP